MKKRICKKLASIALCVAICLSVVPLDGYGAGVPREDAVDQEEPSVQKLPQGSIRQSGESTQQPGESAKQPGEAEQQPGESTQQSGESAQQTSETARQPGEAAQQPQESTQQPEGVAHRLEGSEDDSASSVSEEDVLPPQGGETETSAWDEATAGKKAQRKTEDQFEDYPFYEDEAGNRYRIYTDGDYSFFSKDDKTAVIREYNGTDKNVDVPEMLTAEGKSYTVTTIGFFAFSRQDFGSIMLPETVEKLENRAFYCGCSGHIYLPKSITSIEGEQAYVSFWCWKDSYAYQYLKKNGRSEENGDIFCVDNPPKPDPYVKKLGSKDLTLEWKKVPRVSGYKIVSCDKNGNNCKDVSEVTGSGKTSYQVNGLKSNQFYYFRVCSWNAFRGTNYYGEYSPVVFVRTKSSEKSISSVNQKIKKGYEAKVTKKQISLPVNVVTTYDTETVTYKVNESSGLLMAVRHGDWAAVSELTNFWDHKGKMNVVTSNRKTVYIMRYNMNFRTNTTVKIKKKYPLLGDVLCDEKGNYYIVWGKEDTSGKGGCVTMAVSKYTYSGKHCKTVKYKTDTSKKGGNDRQTKVPFEAGNCSSVIADGVLVCLYGRGMYNGHQSSGVIAVNTEKMTRNSEYSTYTSHSFDQRVIALKDGGVCYADHGDAYPRGFHISFSKTDRYDEQTPFRFYGDAGVNTTNAWLGGVCETATGIMLSGASRKSLKAGNGGKNLFVQLVDKKRRIAGSKSRKGTSDGSGCTDKGVKWLTNYSSAYDVANPKLVKTDDGRMVVLWEKFRNGAFLQSYYMVLAEDGTTLQNATPMKKARLASFEEPLYKNGKIYWVTAGKIQETMKNGWIGYEMADGKKAVVNCLEIGKLVKK